MTSKWDYKFGGENFPLRWKKFYHGKKLWRKKKPNSDRQIENGREKRLRSNRSIRRKTNRGLREG